MTAVEYDGSTHERIVRDCLEDVVGIEPAEEDIEDGVSRWVSKVKQLIEEQSIPTYNGVEELLAKIRENAYLGLVTGNPQSLGPLLLDGADIARFFPEDVQVYGDMFGEEGRVSGIHQCYKRAQKYYETNIETVIYLGDNARDVRNGNRAKEMLPVPVYSAAVAHASGRDPENIREANPDFFFADFQNTAEVARTLLDI